MSKKITPIRRSVLIDKVGGLPDEVRVTLAFYGVDLMPDGITKALGCSPTKSHVRGDRAGPRSPPFEGGAWLLTMELQVEQSLSEGIRQLLAAVPGGVEAIRQLSTSYDVRIRVAMHADRWNSSFGLDGGTLEVIAKTGASLAFDLYLYGEES